MHIPNGSATEPLPGAATVRRRGRYALFPRIAAGYCLLSVLTVFSALLVADRLLIPILESRSRVVAAGWKDEDLRLMRQNYKKIRASADHVWSTRGFHVGNERTRPHRILAIGDSFTWGDGYANINDLWWRQLERELRRRGYPEVEVIAGAMPGMSTRDELELAKHLVPELRPDMVIFGYVSNDPEEGLVPYLETPRRDNFETLLEHARAIFPNIEAMLTDRHKRRALLRESGNANGFPYPERELRLLQGRNFERYRSTLAELHDYFAFNGVPVISVTLPQFPSRSYFEPRYTPVRAAYAQADVPFIDLLDPFVARYGDVGNDVAAMMRWGINPANIHPGPRAAHFYATSIASLLESRYASILGTRVSHGQASTPHINDWLPYDLEPAVTLRNTVAFEYPAERDLLRMAVGRPYIQMSFADPVELDEIRLIGPALESAIVAVSELDSRTGFDNPAIHSLGAQDGTAVGWKLARSRPVTTLRLSARFRGVDRYTDRHLQLVIVPASGALTPMDFQRVFGSPPDSLASSNGWRSRDGRQEIRLHSDAVNEWFLAGAADFDGDHKPDLLWFNQRSGNVVVSGAHGDFVLAKRPSTEWSLCGAADLNGDGRPDLLWRDVRHGLLAAWMMNGRSVTEIASLPAIDSAWSFAGAGDFDADGMQDLVWRNTESGENEIWLMGHGFVRRRVALQSVPALASRIEAVGDIDGDGHPDLIWRNYSGGAVVAWVMKGTELAKTIDIATIAAFNSEIHGLADFDLDGSPDLLWRNVATGDNIVWRMKGSKLISTFALPSRHDAIVGSDEGAPPGGDWEAEARADFDGDHRPDIVWRNRISGANAIYLTRSRVTRTIEPLQGLAWEAIAAADVDGDGNADIVWRDRFTGETSVWLMQATKVVRHESLPSRVSPRWTLAAAADFDGDGRADLLWHQPDGERYLLQTARGTLMPFQSRDDFEWAIRKRWETHGS